MYIIYVYNIGIIGYVLGVVHERIHLFLIVRPGDGGDNVFRTFLLRLYILAILSLFVFSFFFILFG